MGQYFEGFFDIRFHYFALLAISYIAFIGLILSALKNCVPTREAANKIWIAYKPWFFIAPICLLSIGIGKHLLIASFFLLSFFSIKEFIRATGLQSERSLVIPLYIGTALIYFSSAMNWQPFFIFIPTLILAVFLLIPPLRDEYKHMIKKVGLSLIAIFYLAWFPAHLSLLAHYPASYLYLLFLIIGTELNDASAYLCGHLFGKRLLSPKISPKKTIEGALGAFIIVSCYVWLVHSWVPGFNFHLCALSVLLLTFGGTCGDLIMSFFKRDMGIKDMGSLIPGHGGLLDRVDSLLLISPFYFYIVHYLVPFTGRAA